MCDRFTFFVGGCCSALLSVMFVVAGGERCDDDRAPFPGNWMPREGKERDFLRVLYGIFRGSARRRQRCGGVDVGGRQTGSRSSDQMADYVWTSNWLARKFVVRCAAERWNDLRRTEGSYWLHRAGWNADGETAPCLKRIRQNMRRAGIAQIARCTLQHSAMLAADPDVSSRPPLFCSRV